jgi:dihydrofolate reductase
VRKLVVSEFVSLDGVMEAPGGEPGYPHSGWTFQFDDPGQGAFKLEEVLAADALLLGRVTYEGFAAAWPSVQDEAGFGDKMNSMPKYVVSTTLDAVEWNNSTLIKGNVAEGISKLKATDGGDILVAGSRLLVYTLMEHDLVDEYRLMIFPVVPPARRWDCDPVIPVHPARHLLRAKDLADGRYREPLDITALARAARLSPAHFSREFRRTFGESPHRYLLTRRLERAA